GFPRGWSLPGSLPELWRSLQRGHVVSHVDGGGSVRLKSGRASFNAATWFPTWMGLVHGSGLGKSLSASTRPRGFPRGWAVAASFSRGGSISFNAATWFPTWMEAD